LFWKAYSLEQNLTIKDHGQKFALRLLQVLARPESITLMCLS